MHLQGLLEKILGPDLAKQVMSRKFVAFLLFAIPVIQSHLNAATKARAGGILAAIYGIANLIERFIETQSKQTVKKAAK